jgi:Mg-chelatase subunit ChlD
LDTAFDLFIDELDANNAEERVGIVSFASDFTAFGVSTPASRVDLDLTANLNLTKSQMNQMSNSLWNGNTYIEAGMRDGMGVLNSSGARSNAEKTLIVLTDGRQNQGEARLAAADAATDNITIHTITFGDYADRALMAEIAVIGDGKYAHADDAAGLEKILRDLAVTLTTLVE